MFLNNFTFSRFRNKQDFFNKLRPKWVKSFQPHLGLHPNPEFLPPLPFIPQNLLNGTKLFSNRQELIKALADFKIHFAAEVGVQEGFFNEFLMETLTPKKCMR